MPVRLARVHEAVSALIRDAAPEAVAVEELFFSRNVSTALLVGQARGVVLLAAGQAGVPVYEYKPREVKVALTGYGAADKRQVQDMLRLILGLAEAPTPDDAADAVAVAMCHLQSARLRALG
jgi:crossover junction endodeoxyribonuclease RuvC